MQVNGLNKLEFMADGGEMGALIRSIDWSKGPLGYPAQWPQSLRTALSIMLDNGFPMSIVWGPSWIQFYNDAYRPILGASKHPMAMGNSVAVSFPEVWDIVHPLYQEVMAGKTVKFDRFLIGLNRNGFTEECYFDFSYSPIRDESGGVGGILAAVYETTEIVINERRTKTLRDLALRSSGSKSMASAFAGILQTLQENIPDIPFAQLYQHGGLVGSVRFDQQLDNTLTGKTHIITNLSIPGGEGPEPANSAYVVPVASGVLVLGISPRKAFDEAYRDFFDLAASYAGHAISNALANETLLAARDEFYSLFMQAPVAIMILRKPNYFVELVNDAYTSLANKKVEDLAGKYFFDVMPDLAGQGYEQLIDNVMQTGERFVGNGLPIDLFRNGKKETAWFNFIYHPLRQPDGTIDGVMMTGVEVSNMVLAQKRIEQSEAYFKRVADDLPVMIWMTGPDGHCVYLNQRWYEYTGQTPDTALGTAWLGAVHPDDMQQTEVDFFNANNKQQAFSLEYRLRGKDGIYKWMLDSGAPLFDEQGNYEGFIGSVIDIHQRKLSETAMRESETRFRQLADSMPQIVWTANPDGYTDYYNNRWFELVGRTDEYGDDSYIKHLHPDDRRRSMDAWHKAVETGETYELEYRYKIKSTGQYRWFLARALPIRDNEGQIVKWFGTCTDIDDFKNIESTIRQELEKRVAERTGELSRKNEELRMSEERYLRMTNEVEDYAIILLSKEGFIENWNKGAEKIKGYPADEIIGEHFQIFYNEEDRAHKVPEALIAEATQKGKATFEGWRIRKGGSAFWASTVITALHDDYQQLIGFSKVTRDLTERKLADDTLKMYADQLEQKNRELERSNSELSSFTYVASHDLQEPLRKIQSFGNLIQNKDASNLSDISKDYFDRMVKAAIRMQHLIDSLLEFSRTATGRKTFEDTDLNAVVDDVKKELADRIEEKRGLVQSGNLPVLHVIPFQIRQLLFNLVNNSLKYAREDVPPVIDINAQFIKAKDMTEPDAISGRDYYKFSIVDNGIGFEQEYAEKVFELFQRLHGRNEYSGSGIGLAICKKIVEHHNGFIRAESEPGKGAAFYFFIPVGEIMRYRRG